MTYVGQKRGEGRRGRGGEIVLCATVLEVRGLWQVVGCGLWRIVGCGWGRL